MTDVTVLQGALERELTEGMWTWWWNVWSLLRVLNIGAETIQSLCLYALVLSDEICALFIIHEMYNQMKSWSKCEYQNELCFSTTAPSPLLWKFLTVKATQIIQTNFDVDTWVEIINRNSCSNLHLVTSLYTYSYWQCALFRLQHAETKPKMEAH